ncbi:protein THYLAKOID ASSEMBLY 8, chloroplastic [Rhododendron vialii]|uniref:protein THYLAKOID ASSEMBLY 8, chloroplastic n=1 Tax=Rhododendron vialii TaxID=182163 RepID=UPI00265FD163|nr:protein THYLAKOID ASSEMBLY 8, chloroplastic [Rhododendron vialii]XP_058224022.1 protein THYLAKOID ASSEMBLY 8, chloroplastic [Rhododendron vialii]XP_058224023.1 protein THYLAKOID ASSEMBLY 8, chloroplastic [Rhododendron vialii]
MNWSAIKTTLPTTPFFASFNLWDTNRQLPKIRHTRPWEKQMLSLGFGSSSNNKGTRKRGTTTSTDSCIRITMKDRSKNRKPLQRGRNLSIEAIQTIQALKRAAAAAAQDRPCSESLSLDVVFSSKFTRLLKLDMMAVLHELLRQNECLLALKVFKVVQNEHWYKPQISLYGEIISVLGSNELYEKVDLLFTELKTETGMEHDIEGFNVLLENLMSFDMIELAMECFFLMKSLGCEPDKSSFRILINGLESKGETGLLAIVRQEAEKYYGEHLAFLEKEELVGS